MTSITAPRVLTTGLRGTVTRDVLLVVGATAFIALSAQVAVRLPFTPVPVTGQTLAVLLSAAALGPSLGVATSALYLSLALAGLPVLAPTAEGTHATGMAVLSSPSLGYVLGFLAAGWVVGRLAERGFTRTALRTALAMVAGNAVIYLLGVAWLQHAAASSWSQAVAWGLTPFLIGDAIKVALAAGLLPAAWRLTR